MNRKPKTFNDVVEAIRCPDCNGTGAPPHSNPSSECEACNGSGINPDVIDEASGWGTWSISVHDGSGTILVVPLD